MLNNRLKIRLVFFFLCSGLFQEVIAGELAFVETTRLIFNESERVVGFPVRNDTSVPYLFHGVVYESQDGKPTEKSLKFRIVPEVFTLSAGYHQTFKVIQARRTGALNQEQLYFMRGTFIPAHTPKGNSLIVDVPVAINLKMFVRPKTLELPNAVGQMQGQLQFKCNRNFLKIFNPTPYHLTFNTLVVNGSKVTWEQSQRMLLPRSQTHYDIKDHKGVCNIKYSMIDDDGRSTREQRVTVKYRDKEGQK